MEKPRNGFIKSLRYLFLIGVFTIGLMTIVASGGGGGGSGDGAGNGGGTQGYGTIQGVVQDATTQNPIGNASVSVQGTNLSDITDTQGHYAIANVPEGTQTVVATAAGYTSQSKSVNVAATATVTADFSLTPLTGTGETYYVATSGNDANPGTESRPWATFQYAADTAQPGDTIYFRGGTYPFEETHLTSSGTAESYITFIAYPGESPILDGEGNAGELLILDQYTSYVRISGFTLRNFTVWGMELSGENRYVQLDHLEIEGGEAAIRFTYGESAESLPLEGPVEHITLEDSIIHGSDYSAVDCTPGPCNHMVIRRVEIYDTGLVGEAFFGSDGLEFARGYPVLVEDCYVHDNGGDGIDLNSRDREGNATGVIVRRNRVMRNHQNGIKLWAGGRIENNVVWGQCNSPVWSGSWPSTLEIFNNTIAYNMWDPDSDRNWALVVGYEEEMDSPPVTLTLVNNIFAFNADPLDGGSTGIYLGPGVTLAREQNNLYWSNEGEEITAEFVSGHDIGFTRAEIAGGTWAQFSGQGEYDLTADPLLASGLPAVDLHLQAASPAVNSGSADGAPTEDAEGRARDAQPDIGAYEYSL